jgi:UDP-GlcNAc:undecaprenyl-phosphate GlcNAc-1-phosphate transferase
VCALAVPVAIRLSRRFGVIAEPGGRHAHASPTPLLGGLAMYVGFAVALVVFLRQYEATLGVLVVSGLAMAVLIIDDRRPMNPWVKLGVQILLALIAVSIFKIEITYFGLRSDHIVYLGLLATPLSVFWLVGMQNTVNFLDGADGLAAGVILIVAIVLMLAAGELRQIDVVQLSAALAGTCAGFLLFNFSPARIFMGDSGAHFLGIALGMISILGVAKVAVAFALAAPALALAVPIADTAWAILRRRMQKTSVATPDLLHLHHRLQSFGLDARQTCYVFYAATALLGALGLTLFGHGRVLAVALVATAALTSTVAADVLLHTGWRIPAPFLRRLLSEPGTR